MFKRILSSIGTRPFWTVLLITGALLISVALYYQHVLEELPCIVCIHMRLIIIVIMLISVSALVLHDTRYSYGTHIGLLTIASATMIERAWNLLGTERGFLIGTCEFTLGFPEWFAIESWFPAVFEVQTSCGYTPEVVFGITMAEALLAISIALLMACALGLIRLFTTRS